VPRRTVTVGPADVVGGAAVLAGRRRVRRPRRGQLRPAGGVPRGGRRGRAARLDPGPSPHAPAAASETLRLLSDRSPCARQCHNNNWHCFEHNLASQSLATLPPQCRPSSRASLIAASMFGSNGCAKGPSELLIASDGAVHIPGAAPDCWCLRLEGLSFGKAGGGGGWGATLLLLLVSLGLVYSLAAAANPAAAQQHWAFWRSFAGLVRDGVSFSLGRGGGGGDGQARLLDEGAAPPAHGGAAAPSHGGAVVSSQPRRGSESRQASRGSPSPLHHAASTGNHATLQRLLDAGAGGALDRGDHRSFTPFHVACAGGSAECVLLLLRAGCDATCAQPTPPQGLTQGTAATTTASRATSPPACVPPPPNRAGQLMSQGSMNW